MKFTLDIDRYKELLEKESRLNKQNSSLIYENREEFLELLSYPARVQNQIAYERRNDYYSLISKYIQQILTLDEFRWEFIQMETREGADTSAIRDDLEQLAAFSVDSKADEFSSLTNQLSEDVSVAEEFGPEDGISDAQFHDSIQKTYLKMQKFLGIN